MNEVPVPFQEAPQYISRQISDIWILACLIFIIIVCIIGATERPKKQ